jgi:hypothetical protein
MKTLVKGDHFIHKHWLNPATMTPMECVVTKIAQGVIYWRPYYGKHDDGEDWLGAPAYFQIDHQSRYVSRIL